MDTKVMTAHVPLALAEKVDEWAARLERPRAWIIKQALADWVADEERRHQGTLEALAEVDAGRVVSHDRVMAWLDSLGSDQPLPMPSPDGS
jgi:predicted transcriptional regulator